MKKRQFIIIACIFTTLCMVMGGIQAGNSIEQKQTKSTTQTKTTSFDFSSLALTENNGLLNLNINELTRYRNSPGEPQLPVLMNTIELPFETQIKDIQYTITGTQDIQLSQKITPASRPVVDSTQKQQQTENKDIYTADQYFPKSWFSYRLTGGLNKNNIQTTFLTIQVNPVRYNPVQGILQTIDTITLDITYTEPLHPYAALSDAYDMVIICYDRYASLLAPLVAHKNSYGVQTKLVTMTEIKDGTYFETQGKDIQENIKYFIKNAKETWNITYVLLVGNFAQVPVRYSNTETDTGGAYEELKFASDLYYADLYEGDGNFSSWDTNDNGIYGEWPYPEGHAAVDIIDLDPDVHVGRLACMGKTEVRTMVDKIITYETSTAGQDWFKRMVVIGGDTFDKSWEAGTDYNEGEVATAKALDIMPQFNPVKLWTSLGNLTTENIQQEISKGCGFLYFCGHGSPKSWATHANGDYVNWTGQLKNTDMIKFSNKDKYPIMMVGGCHNSEIDVKPMNFIIGLLNEGFHYFTANETWLGSYWKYNYAMECWSWVIDKTRGGAIASMGSSGYGAVNIGDYNNDDIPDCIQGADGWFEVEFFRLYNQDNITILGQTYDQSISGYVHNFPVDTNRYDTKVVETHILLGDPSLKIGGYE